MSDVKKVRTACRQCHGGCGVIAHVQDGKVIKVEGDSESPISRGTLCSKGLSVTQLAYHPDRILHPMRKTTQGWQRISWDVSNINMLTDNAHETMDPAIGATNLRTCLCSIAPVQDGVN
jgi:anaerobic selenocysteine-containing dehydrogenase